MKESDNPSLYRIASLLATQLGESIPLNLVVKLQVLIQHAHSQGMEAGAEIERQHCISICKENSNTGESWWDAACNRIAEQISDRTIVNLMEKNHEQEKPKEEITEPKGSTPTQEAKLYSFNRNEKGSTKA